MGNFIVAAFILLFVILGAKKGFARALVGVLSSILSIVTGVLIYRPVSSILNKSGLRESIESSLETIFKNNTNSVMQSFKPEIISLTTMAILNIICFIAITLLSRLLIKMLIRTINFAVHFPVINEINVVLGGAMGFISGILLFYIICGIIGAVTIGGSFEFIADILKNSELSNVFYENNLITQLLSTFIN